MYRATPSGRISTKLGIFGDLSDLINCPELVCQAVQGFTSTGVENRKFRWERQVIINTALPCV
jgi:hypothetical protein